jgi:LacI family transcriptional regulator
VIVNIKDIARHAGVSVATVSHVINRSRYVSDGLSGRVEKAMKDLDYQPNLLAGSLRKKKTGTIGLIIPDSSNMLYADLSRSFEDTFFLKNCSMMICNSAYMIEREIEHLKNLRSKMVDGILMIPASTEGGHIQKIMSAGIPVVLLDRKIEGLEADYVLPANYRMGYMAGKYLTELGHRKIGYIDRFGPHFHSIERVKGFRAALAEAGIAVDDKDILAGGLSYDMGAQAAKEIIARDRQITALLCFNDINALGAIRGLSDIGLKVPEDISVMGIDDIDISSIFIPGLTTLRYPVREMVDEASKILFTRIKKPEVRKYREVSLEPELIIRGSTKKAG